MLWYFDDIVTTTYNKFLLDEGKKSHGLLLSITFLIVSCKTHHDLFGHFSAYQTKKISNFPHTS